MTRIALPLSILAAAVLSACSSPGPSSQASQPITPQQVAYRSGSGVVQSVTPAPSAVNASSGGSAASRTPASESGLSRLAIKMDDGSMQYIDTATRDFSAGTRVRLTQDRLIERQ